MSKSFCIECGSELTSSHNICGGCGTDNSSFKSDASLDIVYDFYYYKDDFKEGVSKRIKLDRNTCRACDGSRAEVDSTFSACENCKGSGIFEKNKKWDSYEVPCKYCKGAGEIPDNPCEECNGYGTDKKRREVRVKVPPGMEEGDLVTVEGKGKYGENEEKGDLILKIVYK